MSTPRTRLWRTWIKNILFAILSAVLLGWPTGFALLIYFQSRDVTFWFVTFPLIIGTLVLAGLMWRSRPTAAAKQAKLMVFAILGSIALLAFDGLVVAGFINRNVLEQTWQDSPDVRANTEIAPGLGVSGDERGAYVDGVDGVKTYMHHLLTVTTVREFSQKPSIRNIAVDLTKPVRGSGAIALGTVPSVTAIKSYWYKDTDNIIHAVGTIPIDSTVFSDRTDILLTIDGRQHRLTMGPWASTYGDAEPGIGGGGTTAVSITRSGETEYMINAPPGSVARLWDISDSGGPWGVRTPIDRGLYEIGLQVRYRRK